MAALLFGVGSIMNWYVKYGHAPGFHCSWKGLGDNKSFSALSLSNLLL